MVDACRRSWLREPGEDRVQGLRGQAALLPHLCNRTAMAPTPDMSANSMTPLIWVSARRCRRARKGREGESSFVASHSRMGSTSKKHCCLDLDHVHAPRGQLLGGPYVLLPQRRGEGVVADIQGTLRVSDRAEGQMAAAREKTGLQDTASTGETGLEKPTPPHDQDLVDARTRGGPEGSPQGATASK